MLVTGDTGGTAIAICTRVCCYNGTRGLAVSSTLATIFVLYRVSQHGKYDVSVFAQKILQVVVVVTDKLARTVRSAPGPNESLALNAIPPPRPGASVTQ